MQFTFECELISLHGNDRPALDELMLRYSSAKRVAFNRLLEGRSVKEVIHHLESIRSLSLNWRYCEHAARDALAEIRRQRELLSLYLSDAYNRIQETERKLNRLREKRAYGPKLSSLEKRLSSLTQRKELLEEHIAKGTIPKVIFGTRSLFLKRVAGKITREQWRDARNNQVYSIGQANQRGNANIRIHPDGEGIGINFPRRIEPRTSKKGMTRVKSERRWFRLRVPERFRKYAEELLKSNQAYSVRVLKKNGRSFAHLSFEIHNSTPLNCFQRVASIDSNPEGFAAAMVKSDGNLIAHKFFRDERLVHASDNKRDAIIGELVSKIVEYARANGAGAIIIEDLHITSHRDFGRRGNRVIYAFVRKKFLTNLLVRCWKEGVPVFSVNPAYTSKIGYKYRERYGLSIHEAAALCVGRRFYRLGEKFKEPLAITVLSGRSKQKERMPVRRVWASIYGYHHPSDPYMEPPGWKGSGGATMDGGNGAVFTGRPAGRDAAPKEKFDEGERKGGECRANRQVTGNGGKPAPSRDGGKATAASLCG